MEQAIQPWLVFFLVLTIIALFPNLQESTRFASFFDVIKGESAIVVKNLYILAVLDQTI